MTNIEIGTRITSRRREIGLTMDELAQRVGVAKSTIQRYEAGKIVKIKLPVIESIAHAMGVNPCWIIGKSENKLIDSSTSILPKNVIPMPEMRKIPLIGNIACGAPILADEHVEDLVDIPSHIRADFALTCKGDSMVGARIFDGDLVYIRQQGSVESGEIAAVLVGEDEATLKRVRIYDDHIILEPENPMYKPAAFWDSEMSRVRIIGKAVAFTSSIK